jgi:hypothetical protein
MTVKIKEERKSRAKKIMRERERERTKIPKINNK